LKKEFWSCWSSGVAGVQELQNWRGAEEWIRALIEEGVQELQEFRSCRIGGARRVDQSVVEGGVQELQNWRGAEGGLACIL
jgi:hypothetical protein